MKFFGKIKYSDLCALIVLSWLMFMNGEISAEQGASGNDKSLPANKIVIARVAGREITLQDFIERAEYTIRPVYCREDRSNDKNIILNTLISEKILALESGNDNTLVANKKFQNFIQGRKEQKMRSLLSQYEGDMKVSLDTSEIKNAFSLAGRKYKLEYFNVSNGSLSNSLNQKFAGNDSAFEHIFRSFSTLDTIPAKEVDWFSKELKPVHQALFSSKLKKDQVIGPINLDDTTHLFIKIKGWTDRLAVTETDFNDRYNEVVETLRRTKADSIYDAFVLKVMGNKKLEFNAEVFNSLIKLLAPYYLNLKKEMENEFMAMAYRSEVELPNLETPGSGYDEIKNLPVLSIDGKEWSVSDLKGEMDKHPLVFRRQNQKENFAHQLRLAIVDLVRDKYLTDAAYGRNLDKDDAVAHYEQNWKDASVALYEKDKFLKINGLKENGSPEFLEKNLNPFVKSLLKKYSDCIEVNVDEYDKIKLTKIDMFSIQADVPYRIYVPAFPQLTTYNRLNYGKKMDANKNITAIKTKK